MPGDIAEYERLEFRRSCGSETSTTSQYARPWRRAAFLVYEGICRWVGFASSDYRLFP